MPPEIDDTDQSPDESIDHPVLLSDEPTVEPIVRAKAGDEAALEAVLQRCLPPLRNWAHGRLPAYARGEADTEDLVQQAIANVLARLNQFQPTHVGAMQAYLRQCVINDIRSRIRVVSRRSVPIELPDELASEEISPLERAILADSYDRYRASQVRLSARDREVTPARLEAQ